MYIALLGDVSLSAIDISGYENTLENLKNELLEYDYRVCNLESVFVKSGVRYDNDKTAVLASLGETVSVLKFLNINAVNLSNNHILDFGEEALKYTISILEDNNISYFGVYGKTIDLSTDCGLIRFRSVTSFDTNANGLISGIIDKLSYEEIIAKLEKDRDESCHTVYSMHFGLEGMTVPSVTYLRFARELAQSYNYTLYGHHPHVLQGIETVNGSVLAYSLGNAIFSDIKDVFGNVIVEQSTENKSGVILGLNIDNNINYSAKYFDFTSGFYDFDRYRNTQDINSELLKISNDAIDKKRSNDMVVHNLKLNKNISKLKWFLNRLNVKTFRRLTFRKLNSILHYYHFSRHFK